MDMDPLEALKHIRNPIGIRTDHIAPWATTIHVKQNSSVWSSSNFTVTSTATPSSNHAPSTKLFEVSGNFWSLPQRRHVRDPSGLPLFEISRATMNDLWHVHLPGEKGRKESDKKENEWAAPSATRPIASIIPKYNTTSDGKFDVHFRNAAAAAERYGGGDGDGYEKEVKLTARMQNIWKNRAYVLHRDRVVVESRLVDVAALYIPGKRPCWEVRVAEGIDLAQGKIIWLTWLASAIVVLMATTANSAGAAAAGAGGGGGGGG
ncbi:uncharacterized protein BDV17DRAFT_293327 [Aspergillus undulatus]|uniref:uncharacterized protein n=1 Tax=Aspergillus undulatus TaxID=1810928 RepID=UPI003CCD74C3